MTNTIYVVSIMTAKAGKLDALNTALQKLSDTTHTEKGVIEYFFIQHQEQPNVVISYEKWQDAEAEAAHWQTPHLKQAQVELQGVLAEEPKVYKGLKFFK